MLKVGDKVRAVKGYTNDGYTYWKEGGIYTVLSIDPNFYNIESERGNKPMSFWKTENNSEWYVPYKELKRNLPEWF